MSLVGTLLVWSRSGAEPVAVESFVQCPIEGCTSEAVGTSTGRLWLEHEDITADPVSGAVGLQRTYFRGDTKSSSFGPGWRSILDTRLESETGVQTLAGFASLPGAPLEVDANVVTFADGTRWAFDDDGSLAAITTRAGRVFSIDREDDRATILDGKDPLIEITYKGGRVERVDDKRSNSAGTLVYRYEAERLVAVTSSNEEEPSDTYRYDYNPGGGLKRVVDAGGATQINWADARTVGRIEVGGQSTTIQLPTTSDEATLVSLPGATKATEYRHDAEGRLIEIRQGESVPLRRSYDSAGRLILERDAADERRYTWAAGQLARVESEANGSTELEWDDTGRLAATRTGDTETTYEYARIELGADDGWRWETRRRPTRTGTTRSSR